MNMQQFSHSTFRDHNNNTIVLTPSDYKLPSADLGTGVHYCLFRDLEQHDIVLNTVSRRFTVASGARNEVRIVVLTWGNVLTRFLKSYCLLLDTVNQQTTKTDNNNNNNNNDDDGELQRLLDHVQVVIDDVQKEKPLLPESMLAVYTHVVDVYLIERYQRISCAASFVYWVRQYFKNNYNSEFAAKIDAAINNALTRDTIDGILNNESTNGVSFLNSGILFRKRIRQNLNDVEIRKDIQHLLQCDDRFPKTSEQWKNVFVKNPITNALDLHNLF